MRYQSDKSFSMNILKRCNFNHFTDIPNLSLEMSDIKLLLQNKITKLFTSLKDPSGAIAVLICDDTTLKVVSSCLRVHEINELGIGAVLNITYQRERLPHTTAVYFLTPSKQSIQALLDDFSKKPQYGKVYVYTTGSVSPGILEAIGSSHLADHLEEFQEVPLDFQAIESRLVTLGRRQVLAPLYFPDMDTLRGMEIETTASQIASLCFCLSELPYVRFTGSSRVCEDIARTFEKEMVSKVGNAPSWTYNENRATLVVLDRAMDPVAPLMHEYSYQAMVHDLLHCEGQVVQLPNEKIPFVLSDKEELFACARHEHISAVSQLVTSEFDKFRRENATAKLQGSSQLKDMVAVAKALPQYQEEMRKFAKHIKLAEACFDAFDKRNLKNVSSLEQDMATGVDESGKKTKKNDIISRIIEMIQDDSISHEDKLRLVMIYIISQDGIAADTRRKLFSVASFSETDEEAVRNLSHLGVTLQTSSKKASRKQHDPERIRKARERAQNVPLELMRFQPVLHDLLMDIGNDKLTVAEFPYVKEPPPMEALVSSKSTGFSIRGMRKKKPDSIEVSAKSRIIVFVAGGVTFSEIRSLYEAVNVTHRDMILVSSNTITAEQFITDMKG